MANRECSVSNPDGILQISIDSRCNRTCNTWLTMFLFLLFFFFLFFDIIVHALSRQSEVLRSCNLCNRVCYSSKTRLPGERERAIFLARREKIVEISFVDTPPRSKFDCMWYAMYILYSSVLLYLYVLIEIIRLLYIERNKSNAIQSIVDVFFPSKCPLLPLIRRKEKEKSHI